MQSAGMLGQHHDRGIESRICGRRVLDLGDQIMNAFLLDTRLAQQLLVLVLEHRVGGRIEDFRLDRGVDGQRMADPERQLAFLDSVGGLAAALERAHQPVDLLVVGGQKDQGIVRIAARRCHRSLRWLAASRAKRARRQEVAGASRQPLAEAAGSPSDSISRLAQLKNEAALITSTIDASSSPTLRSRVDMLRVRR